MYLPKHFQQQDRTALIELMRTYPFATLIVVAGDDIAIDHLPVVVHEAADGLLVLKGHVAKTNRVWQTNNIESCTAVFHGPNAYVSPSAYPSKRVDGKVVPTWNYAVVHAAGNIRYTHDRNWKYSLLEALTREQEVSQPAPWSIADAPAEYIDRLLGAIVGFEVAVTSIEGKWKLSQNQSMDNYQGVVDALASQACDGAAGVAALMAVTNKDAQPE